MEEPWCALKVGNCSCELYSVWCCCPRQELPICDVGSDRSELGCSSCGRTEAAQSPILRGRSKARGRQGGTQSEIGKGNHQFDDD
eukprot:s167_g1.t1